MDEMGRPAFLHRTESTKFNPAVSSNKMLRPMFLVPPFSAALATKVNTCSYSLCDPFTSFCLLNPPAAASATNVSLP